MERWLPCPGFERVYEVSDHGNVRRTETGKVLKPGSTYGYLHVSLVDGAHKDQKRIHVLVCLAFHGPKPSPRHQAAHGDGVRSHNHADNLRWATPDENYADRVLHGTNLQGERHPSAVLCDRDVRAIRRLLVSCVPPPVLADAYGVTPEAVRAIGHRITWRHLDAPASPEEVVA